MLRSDCFYIVSGKALASAVRNILLFIFHRALCGILKLFKTEQLPLTFTSLIKISSPQLKVKLALVKREKGLSPRADLVEAVHLSKRGGGGEGAHRCNSRLLAGMGKKHFWRAKGWRGRPGRPCSDGRREATKRPGKLALALCVRACVRACARAPSRKGGPLPALPFWLGWANETQAEAVSGRGSSFRRGPARDAAA